MSGGFEVLSLRDEDVTKFLASSTHLGTKNCDFQMLHYVYKRRADGKSTNTHVETKYYDGGAPF